MKTLSLPALPITISVTKDDIKRGKRCAARSCPVALAALRAFNGYWITVGMWNLTVYSARDERNTDVVAIYRLPREVTRWIESFDDKGAAEPFTFNLSVAAS